jgi:hypothetical protein
MSCTATSRSSTVARAGLLPPSGSWERISRKRKFTLLLVSVQSRRNGFDRCLFAVWMRDHDAENTQTPITCISARSRRNEPLAYAVRRLEGDRAPRLA